MKFHIPKTITIETRRKASIKTRIETPSGTSMFIMTEWLAERLPLKQGLKHPIKGIVKSTYHLAERLPLKQGLKPLDFLVPFFTNFSRRKASIKTRIETFLKMGH